MHNKGTDPNVYTRVLIYNNSVIKELREYESCLLCCSIQFSWSAVIPFVDTTTKHYD